MAHLDGSCGEPHRGDLQHATTESPHRKVCEGQGLVFNTFIFFFFFFLFVCFYFYLFFVLKSVAFLGFGFFCQQNAAIFKKPVGVWKEKKKWSGWDWPRKVVKLLLFNIRGCRAVTSQIRNTKNEKMITEKMITENEYGTETEEDRNPKRSEK